MAPNATKGGATAWQDERYRQVIEQVEDYAISALDDEGRVATWNEGTECILGYTEEEARSAEQLYLHPRRPRAG